MSENTLNLSDKARIRLLAGMIWLLAMTIAAAGIVLFVLNRSTPLPDRWGFWGFQSLVNIPVVTVGALIARRRTKNPIGWLLMASGLFGILTGFGEEYGAFAILTRPGYLPAGEIIAGLSHWLWLPSMALIGIYTLLLFPDGKYLTPRWRIIAQISALWILLGSIWLIFSPGPLDNLNFIVNPFGIEGLESRVAWLSPPSLLVLVFGLPLMFAAALSLILRYRQAGGEVRQQIKWIAYVAVLTPIAGIVGQFGGLTANLTLLFFVTALPISIGIAILRYRLYDIDILINRTLVYGALTALVIGFYSLAVAATGLVLQTRDNLVGLALTALFVVALFKPLRDNLQRGADRIMPGEPVQPPQKSPLKVGDGPGDELSAGWLQAARLGWMILAVVALIIFVTALPGYASRINQGVPAHGVVAEPSQGFISLLIFNSLISLTSGGLSLALSWVLFRRKFENPAVAAVSIYLLLYGVVMTGPLEHWGFYWLGNTDFAVDVQSILMATPTVALLVLFPNGRFVPDWTRWLLIASIPWNLLALFFPISTENITGLMILGSLWITLLGLGLYAQIYRYRRVSKVDERQQTKWVLFGFALWLGYILISTYPYFYLESMPPGTPRPWWASLSEVGWWASLNIIPVSMTIAITRARLWNIDIVINRTLVYGTLTLATMLLYILVVGALGNLFQFGDSSFITFLTTGLVAILFQPIRDRLQRGVNRLMYGERDDPVAVLSKLGAQIENTGTPQTILAGIVETVAQTLKLPYVAIELGAEGEIAASYGVPVNQGIRIPLIYQGESVGHFVVVRRAKEESFSLKEMQLLENIARQAGAATHNARLTADLQRAHQQLVSAQEEERRRIRQDLHDGLGPQLASQTLTMTAARRLYKQDPQKADKLLAEAIKHAQHATDDIRRVVHDLRPPALDDLGLLGAIKAQIGKFKTSGIQIAPDIPDSIAPLPAAVEVACYLICQEALNNVIRHADATNCTVRLSVEKEGLSLDIIDNGQGLKPDHQPGIGLASMRQRCQELGGTFNVVSTAGKGTHLMAFFPLETHGT